MCVCATAKRRRKQMRLDKRFKTRDAATNAKRMERTKATEARMKKK